MTTQQSESNQRASCDTVPTSSWNVGPSNRWKIFREADRLCSGVQWSEAVPDKSVFVDTLNQLRQDAPSSAFSHAASGFLFRKVMDPSDGGEMATGKAASEFQQKLNQEPSPVTVEWRRSAERVVDRYFKPGWDRHWKAVAADHKVASDKAVAEEGLDSDTFWRGQEGWWYRHVVGGVEPDSNDRWVSQVREVRVLEEGGGKKRVITIASGMQHVLAPLHKMIYAILSRKTWLLRGDASEKRLSGMTYEKGEVWVSGDYESATDNIPSTYSKTLLRLILRRCRHVPVWIRDAAVDSLVGFTSWKGSVVWQGTGQMMGNYLSFPLLCLHNFITFLVGLGWNRGWEIVSKRLLLINGDDILFRARRCEFEVWAENVKSGGLVLSKGKTLVHCRFASINSTFFCITKKVRRVPVIRAKTWFWQRKEEGKKVVMSGEAVASRVQRVALDCRSKKGVVAFFLGVWGNDIQKLPGGGSVTKSCGPIPVPAHVPGFTNWASIVDSVWIDPFRRSKKVEKEKSPFCVGPARGRDKYWRRLSAAWSHHVRWGAGEEKLRVFSITELGRRFNGQLMRPEGAAPTVVAVGDGRGVRSYGFTFRNLWKMARKTWRSTCKVKKCYKGELILRGLLTGSPTFLGGRIEGGSVVKEGLWHPAKTRMPW